MPDPRILIVTSRPDWHGQRLLTALNQAGAQVSVTSLETCGFAIGQGRPGHIHLPGCEDRLPDAMVVRTVGGGSFEQVTKRLSILHALEGLGVEIYNPPRAIERCVDKSLTSVLLAQSGLPTPATWTTESRDEAGRIVDAESALGNEVVLKPLFGAQGIGLKRLSASTDLPAPEAVGHVYYLQRYVPAPEGQWRDWRVLVASGQPIAAMMRVGASWITNVRQGARCVAEPITPEMADLSLRAAAAVGASYAGIDLIRDTEGRLSILEVNSMPAWRGLQSVTGFDIAERLAADIIKRSIR